MNFIQPTHVIPHGIMYPPRVPGASLSAADLGVNVAEAHLIGSVGKCGSFSKGGHSEEGLLGETSFRAEDVSDEEGQDLGQGEGSEHDIDLDINEPPPQAPDSTAMDDDMGVPFTSISDIVENVAGEAAAQIMTLNLVERPVDETVRRADTIGAIGGQPTAPISLPTASLSSQGNKGKSPAQSESVGGKGRKKKMPSKSAGEEEVRDMSPTAEDRPDEILSPPPHQALKKRRTGGG